MRICAYGWIKDPSDGEEFRYTLLAQDDGRFVWMSDGGSKLFGCGRRSEESAKAALARYAERAEWSHETREAE